VRAYVCTCVHAYVHVCTCVAVVYQKMQELLSEQEGIKEAYEQLEGEYMLVETELSAARDRIAKLLAHLEKYVGWVGGCGLCCHQVKNFEFPERSCVIC